MSAQLHRAAGRARAFCRSRAQPVLRSLVRLQPWALPLLAAALVAAGVLPDGAVTELLGDSLLWLLLCAFVLGAVLQASGLAERLALRLVAGARSLSGLCWRLAAAVAATAFVMPATSARAALLLPVFVALARALDSPRATRALALLFPTVILLSAGASLTGAGAHLVAVEAMRGLGAAPLGFAQWAALAAPLALLSCAAATWLVLRLFLSAQERAAAPRLPPRPSGPATPEQRAIGAIALATVGLWLLAPWLGLPPLAVAAAGALAATRARWTGVGLRPALRAVDWRLLALLAALMLLTDAALAAGDFQQRLAGAVARLWPPGGGATAAVALAATLAVLAHAVVASRTARAALLLPLVALPLAGSGVDAALLVFVCVQGSGFCQCFSWSAKPLVLFARKGAFSATDLGRLALPLGMVFIALLTFFGRVVWPLQGLG